MKIALVGSAPSSITKAPYGQPGWEIWGCSPGAYGIAGPHSQAWFELHRWEPQIPGHVGTGQSWFSPEYCEFLIRHTGKVYMAEPIPPEFSNAEPVPVERIAEEFGPFFLNSSLSWMWAMAILKIEDKHRMKDGTLLWDSPDDQPEIAMFGVDMAAHEEYATQRPGCQFFITEAVRRGIKVTVPPESDILQPSFWYGVTENKPMAIKLTARLRELEGRKAAADQRMHQAQQEGMFLAGAIDDVKYMIDTWVTQQSWIEPMMTPTGNESRSDHRKEWLKSAAETLNKGMYKSHKAVFDWEHPQINVAADTGDRPCNHPNGSYKYNEEKLGYECGICGKFLYVSHPGA